MAQLSVAPDSVLLANPVFSCRVLLRERMLYYLKVGVLGETATQALEGIPARYRPPHGTCCWSCLHRRVMANCVCVLQ